MKRIDRARIDYEFLKGKESFYNFFCDFIVNRYDEIEDCIEICTDFKKRRMFECDDDEKEFISAELMWRIKKYFEGEDEEESDMYGLESCSPFRFCGNETEKAVAFCEVYLLQRFVQLEERDYEALMECAVALGEKEERYHDADNFVSLFNGREEIKDVLEDLRKGRRYGFFESMDFVIEEDDEVYRAMFDFMKRNR